MTGLNRFKELVRDKYDSESALARDLGWSRQKLNHYTTGARVPDIADAKLLADQLKVPIDVLIGFFLDRK